MKTSISISSNAYMTLTPKDCKQLENVIKPFLLEAGKYIIHLWGKTQSVSYKNKRDVVTNVDVTVENILRKKLEKILPEAGFIVEEGINQKKACYNWTIDPIDGTIQYANHLPLFFTQISLVKNDVPILGQIYNPLSKQFFSASEGNKTTLNGKIMKPKFRTMLSECIVDGHIGRKVETLEKKLHLLSKIAKRAYLLKMSYGSFFPYIVTGGIDCYIDMSETTKIHDYMPRMIIAKQAGFRSEILLIKSIKTHITTNHFLFDTIIQLLDEKII